MPSDDELDVGEPQQQQEADAVEEVIYAETTAPDARMEEPVREAPRGRQHAESANGPRGRPAHGPQHPSGDAGRGVGRDLRRAEGVRGEGEARRRTDACRGHRVRSFHARFLVLK